MLNTNRDRVWSGAIGLMKIVYPNLSLDSKRDAIVVGELFNSIYQTISTVVENQASDSQERTSKDLGAN